MDKHNHNDQQNDKQNEVMDLEQLESRLEMESVASALDPNDGTVTVCRCDW